MAIQQLPRTRRVRRAAYDKTSLPVAVTPPAVEVLTHVQEPSIGAKASAWARTQLRGSVNNNFGWLPLGVMLLMLQAIALQPALPEEQLAAMSLTEEVIGWAVVGISFVAYAGASAWAFAGRGGGFLLSMPVTLFLAFSVVTCPASGHHAWGSWVIPSFGLAAAAVALHAGSLFAVRKDC